MLDRRDMDDHTRSLHEHGRQQRAIEPHRRHQVEIDLFPPRLVVECGEPARPAPPNAELPSLPANYLGFERTSRGLTDEPAAEIIQRGAGRSSPGITWSPGAGSAVETRDPSFGEAQPVTIPDTPSFGLNMPPSITHPIMTLPNESTTIKSDAPRSFI
jgi:hypothetical protein